jgi:hypothetical protein
MIRPLAILFALTAVASAQAPPPRDAKQLFQSGVKLLEAGDALGALSLFKDAYAQFPSAKILLNIGTTLKQLDRKAEAANAYQRYLDSPDADPQRKTEVAAALADLDQWLGKVAITCGPPDVEVEIDNEWLSCTKAKLVRVTPGGFAIPARREGFQPAQQNGNAIGGQQVAVSIVLTPIPKTETTQVVNTGPHEDIHATTEPTGPRSRFGLITMAHVSVSPAFGGAWLLGGTADVTEQLAVDAAILFGPGIISSANSTNMYMFDPPKLGGYVGASFAFLTGQWRPRASAGMLVFGDSGPRFTVRGAAGVEYIASRHLSFIVELGVEDNLNVRLSGEIDSIAIVPALAATARL